LHTTLDPLENVCTIEQKEADKECVFAYYTRPARKRLHLSLGLGETCFSASSSFAVLHIMVIPLILISASAFKPIASSASFVYYQAVTTGPSIS